MVLMRGGRWFVGWVVGYLLGMLLRGGRWLVGGLLGYLLGMLALRRMREAQCPLVGASGALYTLPCPGCGGSHR